MSNSNNFDFDGDVSVDEMLSRLEQFEDSVSTGNSTGNLMRRVKRVGGSGDLLDMVSVLELRSDSVFDKPFYELFKKLVSDMDAVMRECREHRKKVNRLHHDLLGINHNVLLLSNEIRLSNLIRLYECELIGFDVLVKELGRYVDVDELSPVDDDVSPDVNPVD